MHQHSAPFPGPRPGVVLWAVALFVVAVTEVVLLPQAAVSALLATGGVVAAVAAFQAELRTGPAPAAPVVVAPSPPGAHPAAARPRPRSAFPADAASDFPRPPRFDERGSAAHARPWLLPVRPSGSGVSADEASLGDLHVRAASVVGPGHRCEEPAVPCQDAYRLGRDRAGRHLVVAVADGLSSAARSDLGAAMAVRCAVDAVVHDLDAGAGTADLAADRVFAAVAADLARLAAAHGCAEHDVGCVLVVAVLDSAGGPGWVAHVGDVSVWRRDPSGWTAVVGTDKDRPGGIRTSEVSACLPAAPGAARAVGLTVRPGDTYAFVTDGVGDLWQAHPGANAYFAARWSAPPPVASFVNDVCFDARGEQDDRTAVVVWAGR